MRNEISIDIEILEDVIMAYCELIDLDYNYTYGFNIKRLKQALSRPTAEEVLAAVEKMREEQIKIFNNYREADLGIFIQRGIDVGITKVISKIKEMLK